MFNLKWSALAGGFAVTLSLLIGLINGAGIVALIRAFIFGAAFFVLGSLVRWIISRFLPELLNEPADSAGTDEPGSQVDISVEDQDEAEDSGDMDTMSLSGENGRSSGLGLDIALDQDSEGGYTKEEIRAEDAAPMSAARPLEGPDVVDVLPDLDGMATAFLPPDDESAEAGGQEALPPVRVNPSRNTATRAQGSGEDFSVKEMAQAIQTILRREEKG